ncbi:MAG: hypothetical protein ACR2JE_02450 [Acidobacteriaceae bacterium]
MKKIPLALTAGLAIATAMGAFSLIAAAQTSTSNFYERTEVARVDTGLRIAPVPLTYTKADKYMVGLGSYLVNAIGDCNGCHTNPSFVEPGGDPYLGHKKQINSAHYLAGGQLFGPFVSRNLTPENGLPAGRTWPEFLKEIRTGIDLDHAHPKFGPLLQVMPWPTTDHELLAIYTYLKAIPPATQGK